MDLVTLALANSYTDEKTANGSTADLSNYYTKQEIDNKKFITQDQLPGEEYVVDDSLTIDGAAADAKATGDRLTDIEYQTVTTDLAYEHKDLPEGEKTVTVSGDGTFGNNAYIVSGEDMIPRKTFNKSFPYNGITITRNDKTYHIEGTATEAGSICFAETLTNAWIDITKDISGKSLKMITFSNEIIGSMLTATLQFFDADKKAVNVLNSSGALKGSIGEYFGNALFRVTNFSIPENANIAYMQAFVKFKAGAVFNHDFQFYVVEADSAQAVTLENPTVTITDENITNVFSAPYQSTIETKAPIADYIKYMTANAKGDTATYLTPEAFGAVGDGYTDDIEAITACLTMANATNQTVLMAKKYFITSPIDIPYDGLDVIANEIVYHGVDTALKIRGQHNAFKIHSITSNGIGIVFRADNEKQVMLNSIDINSLIAKSHGIVFYNGLKGICQNTIKFSYVKAGGESYYGLCGLDAEGDSWISENNFYGGQITNCEWAVYGIGGNSKLYGVQIEGNVKGCFYITREGLVIIHPRIAESQMDGSLPSYKFIKSNHCHIYDSSGIYLNQIDLSEAVDTMNVDSADHPIPLNEYRFGTINGRIVGRNFEDGVGSPYAMVYTTKAYVWGKYLIMTPHMAYRKVVTTAELDTRNIGKEATPQEVKALSQLPTKFVVNTTNTEIYLHESYCAFGFNEFEVEQANGFTCKVYDKLNNLVFDGTNEGDGLYRLNVYKDSDKCMNYGVGMLRRDFLGHYWSVENLTAYKPMREVETTANDSNTLLSNVKYNFGEVAALTVEFDEANTSNRSEYAFTFTSGATPTVLTLPDTVKWVNELTVEANKRYEISVVDNIGLWCAVEVSV